MPKLPVANENFCKFAWTVSTPCATFTLKAFRHMQVWYSSYAAHLSSHSNTTNHQCLGDPTGIIIALQTDAISCISCQNWDWQVFTTAVNCKHALQLCMHILSSSRLSTSLRCECMAPVEYHRNLVSQGASVCKGYTNQAVAILRHCISGSEHSCQLMLRIRSLQTQKTIP